MNALNIDNVEAMVVAAQGQLTKALAAYVEAADEVPMTDDQRGHVAKRLDNIEKCLASVYAVVARRVDVAAKASERQAKQAVKAAKLAETKEEREARAKARLAKAVEAAKKAGVDLAALLPGLGVALTE